MAIISKEKDEFVPRYRKPLKDRLTPAQLVEFDKRLQNYKKIVPAFGELPEREMIDVRAYMEDMGALKNGAVVIKEMTPPKYTVDGKVKHWYDCDPIAYEQLSEDIAQWERWSYGKKQQAQAYEHIS